MKKYVFLVMLASAVNVTFAGPICLHPGNPHYFLFRDRPTILITSGEHYGAVINADFDYVKYLDTLASDGLNHTRLFVGPYREIPGAFNIQGNDLAPMPEKYIAAWQRSDTPGAFDGLNKFDLTKWNDKFFDRLKDFCRQAGKRGIVIEINLFCPYYWEDLWKVSPFNAQNNINGVGKVKFSEVYRMANSDIVAHQTAFTQKIVGELNEFDNIYYEVCNEPWVHDVEQAWQEYIVDRIVETEKRLPFKHLVSLNVANGMRVVEKPHRGVSIFNFHYAGPPTVVAVNYRLNKPIGFNETGFAGQNDSTYRIQAWEFILAGGALFNNLDYSFSPGCEDGTFRYHRQQPGGGSASFRKQLKILKQFIDSFDFTKMRPANGIIKGAHTLNGTAWCLANPGKEYAVYARGNLEMFLYLDIPAGKYNVEWLNTKTGKIEKTEQVSHKKDLLILKAPRFEEDIALRIVRI